MQQVTEEILSKSELDPGQEYEIRVRHGLPPNISPAEERVKRQLNDRLRLKSYRNGLKKLQVT